MSANRKASRKTVIDRERRFHLDARIDQIIKDDDPCKPDSEHLDIKQMCEWFRVSSYWFVHGKMKGYGPPVTQFTVSQYCYTRGNVRKWLRERAKMLAAA